MVDGWDGRSYGASTLPTHHSDGTCMSFADGHSEYWKWTDPDTIAWGHWRAEQFLATGPLQPAKPFAPPLDNPDYARVHKAMWGKGPE